MSRMTDAEIVALLRIELEQAEGFDADVLSDKRAKAMEYYFGVMDGAGEGRSQIVSHDVADTVHSLMAQMPDVFLASAVEFVATSEQDEDQAELESDVVRAVLEQNNEFQTFDMSAWDGLTQGNGWISVEVVIDEENQTLTFDGQDELQMTMLTEQLNNSGADWEVVTSERSSAGLVDLTIKQTRTERTLQVTAVAPERMIFTQAEDQFDLQQLRLVAERRIMTVTELLDAGLTKTDAESIPTHTDDYWPAQRAREAGKQGVANYNDNENEPGGHQGASKYKETFICYFMLDINDDGHAERYRIHFGGAVLIDIEPAYCVPYVTGSPLPVPHRIPGQGMYEVMHQIQDSKTGVLRSFMDNLDVMNQSRVGYIVDQVNLDDLTDSRINGAVGCESRDAVWPLPSNDIGQQAIQGLNYLDTVRTARGGASLDMQQGHMQVAQQSALGASLEYSSKEKMAGLYCKNLAQSLLKGAFLLVHKVLRTEWDAPIDAKIKGAWQQADPSQWPERKHARVTVGMTNQEKQQKVQALTTLITQQTNFMSNGGKGIFTDKPKLFNAISDWIRASDLTGNPLEYVTDPSSPEAQEAAQAQAQAQQQQAAAAEAAQDENRELLLMVEKIKSDTDKWQTEMTTRFDYYKVNMETKLREAEGVAEKMVQGAQLEAAMQPAPAANGDAN